MSDIQYIASGLRETDELAAMDSPVHSLHPLPKLIVTIFYILVVTSFHKYNFSGLVTMALYPAVVSAVSGIPVRTCFYKLRFVLPFVCAVGILNPFFDRTALLTVGTVAVSGGMVSMLTLFLKGIFCLSASFLLVATTPVDAVCGALRRLHLPGMLVTLILLTCRYVSVMVDEVAVMVTAYRLRAPGQNGIRFPAWGSFLGQILLRSMDRAQELYASMQLRGYDGFFRYADAKKVRSADVLYGVGWIVFFIVCRYVNLAVQIGSMII